MVWSQIKTKIVSTLTIGVGSWIVALEGISFINKYVPQNNSLFVKGIIVVVLFYIGIAYNNK